MNVAVVVGSTGLTGHLLVNKLVQSGYFSKVICIVRAKQFKPQDMLEELVFDFKAWDILQKNINSLAINAQFYFFCCLGTTIKKAKTKENFLKIDRDYVVEFAKIAESCHAKVLYIVSALGANSDSSVFYNKTKGEMENSVLNIFKSGDLKFFRPSLLLGDRAENRFFEKLFIKSLFLYDWIFMGHLKKYRPIPAERVAEAMLNCTINTKSLSSSVFIENNKIFELS